MKVLSPGVVVISGGICDVHCFHIDMEGKGDKATHHLARAACFSAAMKVLSEAISAELDQANADDVWTCDICGSREPEHFCAGGSGVATRSRRET